MKKKNKSWQTNDFDEHIDDNNCFFEKQLSSTFRENVQQLKIKQ